MLQIISGKFFESDQLNTQDCDAILFSNYSWIGPIDTGNMQLRPVDTYSSSVAAYTVRYTSRYEREVLVEGEKRQAVLVHPHHRPAVDQFRLLCCFYFRAFFHEDRQYVESQCRGSSRRSGDMVPSKFVPRFFEVNLNGTGDEVAGFAEFIDDVMGIQREQYKLFVSCLQTFVDSLESIETNIDLAYSMLIYLLETLSKVGDGYSPQWEDFDQRTRRDLDEILDSRGTIGRRNVRVQDAQAVREALLDGAQLKLTRRFVEGIAELVENSFFLSEASDLNRATGKSQLKDLLHNAYKSRSGYVHQLRPLLDQLRDPAFAEKGKNDYLAWNHEPYFTLSGLIRLTRHVLLTFVKRQPKFQKEVYPQWRDELPGTIRVEVAPENWIWQIGESVANNAHSRFSGVVAHFDETFRKPDGKLTDLRDLIKEIESVLDQTKLEERRSLLGIYLLWNAVIVDTAKSPNREKVLSRHEGTVNECSIQSFAVQLLLSVDQVPWSGEECEECVETYLKRRHRPRSILLPRRVELALMVETANRFLDVENVRDFTKWLNHAILDAASDCSLQQSLAESRDTIVRSPANAVVGFAKLG